MKEGVRSHRPASLRGGVILGIGSPFGDDRLGWEAVESLAVALRDSHECAGVALRALDRPGVTLLEHLRGAPWGILVDAIRSDAPPGTVHRLEGQRLFQLTTTLSSHGLGVSQALALGHALGDLPSPLVVYGIEAASSDGSAGLSSVVAQALPELVERILAETRAWCAQHRAASG